VQASKLGVQRKAEPAEGEHGAEPEVSQPHEPAEVEADKVGDHVADALHDSKKGAGEKHAGAEKAPAIGAKLAGNWRDRMRMGKEDGPEIGAKLEGVGRKIHLAPKDDQPKGKPVNLPSWKTIKVDMTHVLSGHSQGGNRNREGKKDEFPPTMKPIRLNRSFSRHIGSARRWRPKANRSASSA
jgi:hypothetical protein